MYVEWYPCGSPDPEAVSGSSTIWEAFNLDFIRGLFALGIFNKILEIVTILNKWKREKQRMDNKRAKWQYLLTFLLAEGIFINVCACWFLNPYTV